MKVCDGCKSDQEVAFFHLVFAVQGPIREPHEFLSHNWELCRSCAVKFHGLVGDTLARLTEQAAGTTVPHPANPVLEKNLADGR
jgi:hypothetical protein